MPSQAPWTIREFDRKRDADAVCLLDTSFSSDLVYSAEQQGTALVLAPRRVSPARCKRFAIDLDADEWKQGYVALRDGVVRGFVAAGFEAWNRRLVIWHYYVDLPHRQLGAGRLLMERVLRWGRETDAVVAWVETTNVNQPGVEAYSRLGFEICGFDTSLYLGTSNQNEFAVYMCRGFSEYGSSNG